MKRAFATLVIFGIFANNSCKNRETESLPHAEAAWSSDILDGTISLSIQTANSMMHLGFFPNKSDSIGAKSSSSDSEESNSHLDLFSMGVEESLRRSVEIFSEISESPDNSSPAVIGIAADQLTSLARLKTYYDRNLAPDAAGIPRNFSSWIQLNRIAYQDFIREFDTNTAALVSVRDSIRGKQANASSQVQQGIYAQSPSIGSCVTEIFTERSSDDSESIAVVEMVPDTSADNDLSCQPAVLTCSNNICRGKAGTTEVSLADINEFGFVLTSANTTATFLRRDVTGATRFKRGQTFKDDSSPESRSILEPYLSSSGQIAGLRAEFYRDGELVRVGHYLCNDKRCTQKCNVSSCNETIDVDDSKFSISESENGPRRFSLETPEAR
jgi:hypothetical protein